MWLACGMCPIQLYGGTSPRSYSALISKAQSMRTAKFDPRTLSQKCTRECTRRCSRKCPRRLRLVWCKTHQRVPTKTPRFGDRKSLPIAKNHPKPSQEFSEQFGPFVHKMRDFSKNSRQKVHPNFAKNLGRQILRNTFSAPTQECSRQIS